MDKTRWLVLGCLLIVIISIGRIYENHRVQPVTRLIDYQEERFTGMLFSSGQKPLPEDQLYQWYREDPRVAAELYQFLRDYEVRKIDEDTYNELWSDEENTFRFEIQQEGKNPIIVHGTPAKVHILVGDYYEIVGEPIDKGWLRTFSERYGGE
ncbi:hypothetical protein SAMN04487936_101546 [Halobacillus dabanensis]|uniref:Uncharacterized protein n=1 Tax=Halobacillus dabanensis TaxID=240302 RepID=A0A1I3Q6G3_HALDA|nr:hypothetical protein [Halobacillus dabanensis]SFJ28997.1 hypothetical protein SAMN04487936_101546 [Halobacillus dabanensis]